MELIYKGKTKDVYSLGDHQVVLKFKDDVTGSDGAFDPGANQVGLSIEGMGLKNLAMSQYFFQKIQEEGIPSHYVRSDLNKGEMVVKEARPFGFGLEVITRFKAVGSFIRRYGAYIEEGAPLDDYVEFTIKDDQREDPLITKEGLIALGIMDQATYDTIVEMNLKIAHLIKDELASKGLELYDLKLEFGRSTTDKTVMVIDEVSAGNMRVYKDGILLSPLDLADYFM